MRGGSLLVALGQSHANLPVFPNQKHKQDAHHDEVPDDGARQPREIHQQNRDEQREPERDQVKLRHRTLLAQHRDHLVEEIDAGSDAASSEHDEHKPAELLEVHAVEEAHNRDANPTHDERHHDGDTHDHRHDHDDDHVEAFALLGIGPHGGHLHEHRLVDELRGEQDAHGREVEHVVIELVVVGKHAFHDELGHVVDERVKEQRDEQRGALPEKRDDAVEARTRRRGRFPDRERQGEHDERNARSNGHCDAGDADAARDEQRDGEHREHEHRAKRLGDARKVELVLLLEAPLVDVG